MHTNTWAVRIGVCTLFMFGFFLPWWPFMFLAPCIALLYGYWVLALFLALCADLVFGAPVGLLHSLIFPCTVAILFSSVVRSVIIRHLR
ncbi:hypothetical protein K2Q00_03955 [Patescibacteria group bacterium]|nr:hypothetical protein [Patescibacteria group bacterium]